MGGGPAELSGVVADFHAACALLESFADGRDVELNACHTSFPRCQSCVSGDSG